MICVSQVIVLIRLLEVNSLLSRETLHEFEQVGAVLLVVTFFSI